MTTVKFDPQQHTDENGDSVDLELIAIETWLSDIRIGLSIFAEDGTQPSWVSRSLRDILMEAMDENATRYGDAVVERSKHAIYRRWAKILRGHADTIDAIMDSAYVVKDPDE